MGKKYKMQKYEERMRELNNPAKSGHNGIRRKKKYAGAKKLGKFLIFIQTLLSILFIGLFIALDILPTKYFACLVAIVIILLLVVRRTQKRAKKRGIMGKILSLLVITVLGMGSYYLGVINGAFDQLIGENKKIDTMVAAVLKEDTADDIYDAEDYSFGVQYQLGKEDTERVVSTISEELEHGISLIEFEDVQAQAEALLGKQIDAIIFNESYLELLTEEIEDFGENIKIIYRLDIEKDMEQEQESEFSVTQETFHVYLSGVDVYGDISKTSRSDVNIIATVNPQTHQILLTTTPRDMYMIFPGVSDGQKDKLTHAGIYGVNASMAALENFYSIEIPFYARVNFTSIIEIVNQLGGIDVYSEYEFTTVDGLYVKKGMNSFDGEAALSFARERKNVPDGDNQRGKNQQAVIVAMIRKMLSPQMLISAPGIINSVSENMETNMSQKQIQELIKKQLNEGGAWNIYSVAAEGTPDYAYTYSMPNREVYVTQPSGESIENIQNLMNRVENGEILENSEVAE